jgi:hypothetical protein
MALMASGWLWSRLVELIVLLARSRSAESAHRQSEGDEHTCATWGNLVLDWLQS